MRPRFSLLNVLLLAAVVAALMTAWLKWREVGQVEQQMAALQRDQAKYLGDLDVTDPRRPYAVAVADPLQDPHRWRSRVYLPEGRVYVLHHLGYSIPEDGDFGPGVDPDFVDGRLVKHTNRLSIDGQGEVVVDFQLRPSIARRTSTYGAALTHWGWKVAVDGSPRMSGIEFEFDTESKLDEELTLSTPQQSWEIGDPIPLLVLRNLQASAQDRPGTVPGVALVIEDVTDVAGDPEEDAK